jgi:hypothetical protein
MRFVRICLFSVLLYAPSPQASERSPILDEADPAELVGGIVQSAEGIEVGEVSAVAMNAEGEVTEIRMAMEQSLGVGERTVILPRDTYLVLRGTVVVRLPLAEIQRLPSADMKRPAP